MLLTMDRFRPLASVSHHRKSEKLPQVSWAVDLVGRYVPSCLDRLNLEARRLLVIVSEEVSDKCLQNSSMMFGTDSDQLAAALTLQFLKPNTGVQIS